MPKIVDHDAERRAIAMSCVELFAKKGYKGVTMRSIAQQADVSTGKLYHYFPDKRSIFISLFEATSTADLAKVAQAVDDNAPLAVRLSTLIEFADANRDRLTQLLLLAIDVHRQLDADEAADASRQVAAAYRRAISNLLGVEGPLIDVSYAFIAGALISMLLEPERDPLEMAAHFPDLARELFSSPGLDGTTPPSRTPDAGS